jgi:hypothetical protein
MDAETEIWGVLVQKMLTAGRTGGSPVREIILGMSRDPRMGPLLMFGLGGIYVEVFKDVVFRIAPIRELGARHMIDGIKGFKLLQGFRGEPPSDIEAIAQSLMRLSQLVTDFPEIEEMDINPLIVLPSGSGARVIDARILIEEGVTTIRDSRFEINFESRISNLESIPEGYHENEKRIITKRLRKDVGDWWGCGFSASVDRRRESAVAERFDRNFGWENEIREMPRQTADPQDGRKLDVFGGRRYPQRIPVQYHLRFWITGGAARYVHGTACS